MLNIVSDERSATASPPTIQIRSGAWCRAFVDQVPGIGMAHERLDVRGSSGTTRCRYEGGGVLQPVTVRLANWRGLPTALDIPVGFFDPVRSLWVHAGVAKYDWRGLVR